MTLKPTSSRGGSGGGALVLLSTTTLATAGTFDVQNIPQTYNDLVLEMVVRGTRSALSDGLAVQLNADATSGHYAWQQVQGAAAVVSAVANGTSQTAANVGTMFAASATANQFSAAELSILGYTSTTWEKEFNCVSGAPVGSGSTVAACLGTGIWLSTAAVTRVTIFGATTANLVAGSQLRIYGRL